MNIQLLIDSIVRQVTVLIAQLATSGGIRAPMAHLADQVFIELSKELHAQGVSRKVTADMFGMALRSYIRKLRRLNEGKTDAGKTLWQAILDFIACEGMVTRTRVLERFACDDRLQVNSVLRDLKDTGLVFAAGSEEGAIYRAASESEIGQLSRLKTDELDELVWALIFRDGPLTEKELRQKIGPECDQILDVLDRLLADRRIERQVNGLLAARDFVIPLGSSIGWEAAVYDHFHALVRTICQRLRKTGTAANEDDIVGGSTYTYDIWPGHPMENEIKGQLREIREHCGRLLRRLQEYNHQNGLRAQYEQVAFYMGQSITECELADSTDLGETDNADKNIENE